MQRRGGGVYLVSQIVSSLRVSSPGRDLRPTNLESRNGGKEKTGFKEERGIQMKICRGRVLKIKDQNTVEEKFQTRERIGKVQEGTKVLNGG